MKPREVVVNDRMQHDFVYTLTEPPGRNFHAGFEPQLTPEQMLRLGVFGGRYMTDCTAEFPAEWFEHARLCPERHDPELNLFKVNASQPLAVWRAKGGFIRTIRAAGFNGIAVTIRGGAPKTMSTRSGDGKR